MLIYVYAVILPFNGQQMSLGGRVYSGIMRIERQSCKTLLVGYLPLFGHETVGRPED